jgi:glucose-6-phosphate 1-dehydrogenase
MRVQPNEGVSLNFEVKVPGAAVALTQHGRGRAVDMDFTYAEAFGETAGASVRDAAARRDDREMTLFTRSDEVEAAWRLIDPLLEYWEKNPANPMPTYPAGAGDRAKRTS